MYPCLMLRRLDAIGHCLSFAEELHLFFFFAGGMTNASKGYERIDSMPLVLRVFHQFVGSFVLFHRFFVLLCFFVERPEVSMAE